MCLLRKRFFAALSFSLFLLVCRGQNKQAFVCGDEQLKNLLRKTDTAYDYMQMKSNLQLRDYINRVQQKKKTPVLQRPLPGEDTGFIIPVVVHIIYPRGTPYGTGTNISYARVRSQIEALNAAFGKNYPLYNGQSHPAYAANTHIRFCLARNTNDTSHWFAGPGGTEYGVMRYADNTGAYNHFISASSAKGLLHITHPSFNSFPFDKYFNIWLVSTIEGSNNVMGYAPRPIMPGYTLDGVVMRADIFGDNTTGGGYNLNFGLSEGKILAHETGHYLNLYHIFQGGCSGTNAAGAATDACDLNGDMICDTEPCTTQNIFCNESIPNTCTANYATGTITEDMINDYMSYADDNCMNTFTQNQAERMWATLTLQRPTLWQPENLAAAGVLGPQGCVPSYLNAQINTGNAVLCAGTSVIFSNPAAGNTATGYQWQFTSGVPATSTDNNVSVNYALPGDYKAVLKVTDGINTRTDSLLFTVQDCKIDSSMLSMAHWYFGNFGSIDFSSGYPVQTPVAFDRRTIQGESSYTGQLPYLGATVSLSDSMGNLLFYCNGVSVWNKDHQKITTAPVFGASDINASTGLYYIPYPGQKGKYFVAGVYPNFDDSPSGVRFIMVDVNNNIVQPYQEFSHVSLPKRFSQFLTVVPHCNGAGYWIITKGYGTDNPKFYSFLVTSAGIDAGQAPVISSSGITHPGYGGSGYQLKSNRQGNKLILSNAAGYLGLQQGALYDFDSRTGIVSNEKVIPDAAGYSNIQTGTAFSPNGDYFYLFRSSNFATNGEPYWLFQYRVKDIQQYNIIPAPGFYFCSPMQPGPDNQIYVTTQDHFFARISKPDQWGGVSVNGSFINMRSINDSIRTGISIPAFIDAKQPVPAHPDFLTSNINCNTFQFSSLCFDNYTATWNFGDGSLLQTGNVVEHVYAGAGEYTVTLTLSAAGTLYSSASKKVLVLPLSAAITGPANVCTNGNYASQYFSAILPDVDYKWTVLNGGAVSGPDNLPLVNVIWQSANGSGTLQLEVSEKNCLLRTTKTVSIVAGPAFKWSLPDSICLYDSVLALTATPAGGTYTGDGISNNSFSPAAAGMGYHTITYTYFDESTCLGQVEKIIKVARCKIPTDQNTNCTDILNSITIAPNPVADKLQLRSVYALKYVQLYNAVGQKILQGRLNNNAINFTGISSGMYTILVYCEKSMSYKAFRFYKL